MAPVQRVGSIPEIPTETLVDRDALHMDLMSSSLDVTPRAIEVTHTLSGRSPTKTFVPGKGAVDPHNINMGGLMALFALLGAAFVLASIWFFFWAKNGGFVWRKGDWEDYKSTVLRRKGPDGRTLSNATKSTRLGGGSVVGKGYSDDGLTVTDSLAYTETGTAVTEEKEPGRKRRLKESAKQKLMRRHKEERWEGERDDDVRAYRNEKPARVGGMNREADGTYHGSEYDLSNPPSYYQESEMSSEVRDYAYDDHRHHHQRHSRTVSGFSFTAGSEDVLSQATEEHRLRDPSQRRNNRRRDRDEGRQQRRSHAPSSSRPSSPRKQRESRRSDVGRYTEPLDFSSAGTRSEYQYSNVETNDGSGTKSYHHPIPGLSKGYRRDGGGRRKRRDSLSDSDGEETRMS